MRGGGRAWLVRAAIALAAAAAIAAVAAWLDSDATAGDGPRPIAWGEQPCSECHMLIADPRFAAQLLTAEGEARSFDDPGCLLRALERGGREPRALYFHHARQERWLRAPAVAFVELAGSPMGYELGAVDPSEPGAFAFDAARARVRERTAAVAQESP